MKIWSRGDRIRPGRYAVRARFARSMLLLGTGEQAVFVVDRSIGPGPLNLVVAEPNAFVAGEQLDIPRAMPGPRFDSALPRLNRAARAQLRRVLDSALPCQSPPESLGSLFRPMAPIPKLQAARDARFRLALQQIAGGWLAAAVRCIRGCGTGLTPCGDDFLCGMMLTCRLQGNPRRATTILNAARGKNPVSNAFLEMAAHGRVNQALQDLLRTPSPAKAKAVCAFGHSSGADLLWGLWWGLEEEPGGREQRTETRGQRAEGRGQGGG